MIRRWTFLAVAAAAAGLLGGCSLDEHQGDVGHKDLRPNAVVRRDANGNRILMKRFADDQDNEMNRINGRRLNSNNLVGAHKNYRLEMSPDIAERISGLDGVGTAFVMLTDRNAYVAVTPDDGSEGAGTKSLSGISRTNIGHAGDESRAPAGGGYGRGWDGQHAAGGSGQAAAGSNGMAGAGGGAVRIDLNTGRTVPEGMASGIGGTGYGDRYSGADGTGIQPNNTRGLGTHGDDGTPGTPFERGSSGSGSDVNPNGSTLAGGGGTFGTSAGPEGGRIGMQSSRTGSRGGVPAEPPAALRKGTLKERIAGEVLTLAPGIEHVYVSDAPDFAERMSGYALDVRDGHPIQDFIVEFNAMVDRVFPAGSGLEARAGRNGLR